MYCGYFYSFRQLKQQKSSETSASTVVGNMLTYGKLAVTGFGGVELGMCLMAIIKRKKETDEN